jgi:four helix bundle protein
MTEKGKRGTPNAERPTLNDGGSQSRPAYDLEERLLEYSVRIIRVADSLHPTRAGNHVAAQLLRSGTSPLPNHGEAESAESAADFIHKLRVCLKELRESRRWLRLIHQVPLIERPALIEPLIAETEELIRIFVASVYTVQRNKMQSAVVREDEALSERSAFGVGRSEFQVFLPSRE